jgi:hypothetical protein
VSIRERHPLGAFLDAEEHSPLHDEMRRFKDEETERRERNVRLAGATRPDDQSRVPILWFEDKGAPPA